jgi:hypothetical protein
LPLFRYRVRRQRTLPGLVQNYPAIRVTHHFYPGGSGTLPADFTQQPAASTRKIGDQVTDSEEHPQWKAKRKQGDLEDIGGDFFSQKHYAEGKPSNVSVDCLAFDLGQLRYRINHIRGPAWCIDARNYSFPPSLSSTDAQLDALGATAIARCKPTRSKANVGVALGELIREGIPKIVVSGWHDRARNLQTGKHVQPEHVVSDNYLAYQFGLKPLGQEIGTFAAEVIRADQLLAQYERDAGNVVRRRFTFSPKHEETQQGPAFTSASAVMGSPQAGSTNPELTSTQLGELQVTRVVTQKRWFSGAFTYYLPSWYDARSEMSRNALLAKEILGVDLDLETLWNLAPWSWAVDWFSNAGDVISNINSMVEDGLIMRYGYMMEHTIVKDTYTRKYRNHFRGGGILDSHVTLVTETKIRRRANPFGFGLTWSGLSTFQKSIIAALGISKGR